MPAPSHADRRFLELHGNTWRVVVNVPKDLRKKFGTKLKVPLGTDSLSEANRLKWGVVDQLKSRISDAKDDGISPERIMADALQYAKLRLGAVNDDDACIVDGEIADYAENLVGEPVGTDHEGYPVYDAELDDLARTFMNVARGERTPLDSLHHQYRTTLIVKPRTLADDDRAMKYLLEWCRRAQVSPFAQTLTKRQAGMFAENGLRQEAGELSAVTLNKYIRRLSKFWEWLEKHEYVSANIWAGQTLAEPHETDETRERPFSRDEMIRLLNGPATVAMHDLMRIAALSGARLDAIVCLSVGDCVEGNFSFKPQKRERGRRLVPIHSALQEIVQRRCHGRGATDDLFPEWPPVKKSNSMRERSFKASNHFTDYRRLVGVDDVVPGKRRSRVNFHSFRRWFATEAERADQPESIIAAVLGHKRNGITLGVYSAGPLLEQSRRCVEAVSLPG